MSKNSIYNLFKYIISTESKIIPGANDLRELKDVKGKKYYKVELEVEPNLMIGEYSLVSHHISMYESASTRLDLNSQYHYTAYLSDEEYNEYRLHLYYDDNDNCVSRPILSLCESNNKYTRVDCRSEEDAFYSLADMYTREPVQFFRKRQAQILRELDEDYAKLEIQLTKYTSMLPINSDLCLELLQKQMDIQRKILSYSNNTARPLKKIRFLEQFKLSIMNTNYVDVKEQQVEKMPPSNSRKTGKSTNSKQTKPTPTQTGKKDVAPHAFFKSKSNSGRAVSKKTIQSPLAELIAGFTLRLAKIEEIPEINENTVELLEALYVDYINKQWMHEFERNHAEPSEIREFMALRGKIERYGIGVLQRLLIQERYELAGKFRLFFTILPQSILPYALHHDQAKLLELLFKKKWVDAQCKQIEVSNVSYQSIAEYCFASSNNKRSCLTLLDVYVKAEGSLMGIDKFSGLPFAAILLMDKTHPLYPVLSDNPELTINNTQFYSKLNHVLNLLISRKSLPDKLAEQVKLLIEDNNKKIRLIHLGGSKLSLSLIDHVDSFNPKEEQTVGEEYVARLLLDPEFKSIKKELDEVYTRLMKRMPPVQRRKFGSSKDLISYDEIKTELDEIQDLDQVPLFDEFKQSIIRKLVLTTESAKLTIELFDLQNKRQSTWTSGTKLSRNSKVLIRRQEQIFNRLKDIKNELETNALFSDEAHLKSELSSQVNTLSPEVKDKLRGLVLLLAIMDRSSDDDEDLDDDLSSSEEKGDLDDNSSCNLLHVI